MQRLIILKKSGFDLFYYPVHFISSENQYNQINAIDISEVRKVEIYHQAVKIFNLNI